jgi:hypothetical protein
MQYDNKENQIPTNTSQSNNQEYSNIDSINKINERTEALLNESDAIDKKLIELLNKKSQLQAANMELNHRRFAEQVKYQALVLKLEETLAEEAYANNLNFNENSSAVGFNFFCDNAMENQNKKIHIKLDTNISLIAGREGDKYKVENVIDKSIQENNNSEKIFLESMDNRRLHIGYSINNN